SFQFLRAPYAHETAVLPHGMLRIESDVRLRAQRDLHLRNLADVELLVDLLRDFVEGVHGLVCLWWGGLLLTHRRVPPPSHRSQSRPRPPPRAQGLPLPRSPRSSAPSPRAAAPRRSRGPD